MRFHSSDWNRQSARLRWAHREGRAMIELTDDQRRAIAEAGDTPPTVVDGATTYRLIRADVYERLVGPVRPASRVPEGIRRSRAALRRDLPRLLASHRTRGQW